jgi:hypothetical protein
VLCRVTCRCTAGDDTLLPVDVVKDQDAILVEVVRVVVLQSVRSRSDERMVGFKGGRDGFSMSL